MGVHLATEYAGQALSRPPRAFLSISFLLHRAHAHAADNEILVPWLAGGILPASQ
jgi:hypothetical protein